MQRRKFEYLPHMADVSFVAYGPSFKAALENAAYAMLNVMFDMKKIGKEKGKVRTIRISEAASTKEELVWFTLQKIVSKVDEKELSAFRFKVNGIVEKGGNIVLHGCIFYKKAKKYVALLDVKAVTPHDLEVKRRGADYSIKVLVDV